MFSTSTQLKFWTFKNEADILHLRETTNRKFTNLYGSQIDEIEKANYFLTQEEELVIVRKYEVHLRDFCKKFSPTMPKYVMGSAFHYFKRFYLCNSVMNYHPKEIMVTCVYLACKTEEFNVSMRQFIANVKGDREKAADIILNNEIFLLTALKFHLTIHNPFRAIEGLLIDIKTRCSLSNPEKLRAGIEDFTEKVYLTDCCLLYPPSQIALAAVLYAASKVQENLDSYVTDTLFSGEGQNRLSCLIESVRNIRSMVKAIEPLSKDVVKLLDKKLENCRNQENNPDSEIYKKRLKESENTD